MAMASEPMQSLRSAQNPIAGEITPQGEAAAAVGMSSPRTRRRGFGRGSGTVSSPRNQTVRGGDKIAESLTSCSSSSYSSVGNVGTVSVDNVGTVVNPHRSPPLAGVDQDAEPLPKSNETVGGGDSAAKNLAWNNSYDGSTEAGPLMDAKTWPVLSKPTRASLKASSSDSLRTVADGSVSAAQVTGLASPSHNPPNSTQAPYNRQRSMSRGGGNLPSPQGTGGDLAPSSAANDYSSLRDNIHHNDGRKGGLGSLPNSWNEHQHQSHSFRRGNGGPHPRGNASRHHGGYGGKRGDQDRRNQDWNLNRNFVDKDTQRVPTGSFLQGPPFPASGQFILPNMPGRPLGPFIYHDVPAPVYSAPVPHPDLYRAFHPIPVMAPVINPYLDPELNAKILNQIEYYFSNDNLVSDGYLREHMDAQGWVSIKLIAGFKKVMQLTNNIHLILDVLRASVVVEVEGEKIRRRNDWQKWPLPPSFSESTLSSSGSSEDMLSANLQRTVLDDVTVKYGTSEGIYRPSS